MNKLILALSLAFLTNAGLSAGLYEKNSGYIIANQALVYDDFVLNLNSPKWQPRLYYYGLFSNSVGYFHVNNYDGDIDVYGSNRYVPEDNAELFLESLMPFETNLLPYATPRVDSYNTVHIRSQEDASISNLPAKKIVFELTNHHHHKHGHPHKDEIVISYVFTKPQVGYLYNKIVGYTFSVSCHKDEYEKQKGIIDSIFNNLHVK